MERRGEAVSQSTGQRRTPPHDIEAEKAVLSGLLLDNHAIYTVYTEIKPEDFYHPAHEALYRAMVTLKDENIPVDLHTLSDHLKTKNLLESVGGTVALMEIADYEATAANVVYHARIIRDKAVKRHLIHVATEIVESGYEGEDAGSRLLDAAESKIFDIGRKEGRSAFASLKSEMPATFDYIDMVMARNGEISGLSTGFRDLDQITGGLQRGEMIVLAARPSMGKTALALTIAQNASKKSGAKCAVFSLEMTTQSLVVRLLMAEAGVDQSALRKGYLSHSDYRRLVDAADILEKAPIYIDDTGGITILEIKAKCRRLAAEIGGLDLVVVDYLQLVAGDGKDSRKDLEVGEISRGLKLLSKELNCPVLALAQLNRGPEQRDPDKRRPMMGDLRESGAIEQDADVIAFIYRDEYYNKATEEPGIAEIIFAKQRNGPTGTIKLKFEARHARFADANEVTYRDENEAAPSFDSGEFVGPDDVSYGHDSEQDPI